MSTDLEVFKKLPIEVQDHTEKILGYFAKRDTEVLSYRDIKPTDTVDEIMKVINSNPDWVCTISLWVTPEQLRALFESDRLSHNQMLSIPDTYNLYKEVQEKRKHEVSLVHIDVISDLIIDYEQ